MFFHMRSAAADFVEIVKRHRSRFVHGVIHSFDGTADEARQMLDLDLHIGLNGCSLRTEESLEVVRGLPIDRVLIETDAPWCDIRPSHPGSKLISSETNAMLAAHAPRDRKKHTFENRVKGRNEPCTLVSVLDVVAGAMRVSPGDLAAAATATSEEIFFSGGDSQ
jgi:TatD DNase family protein